MTWETFGRSVAFGGMIVVETIVAVVFLFPVSLVELTTNTELGTYEAIKQMHDFTVQIGTCD